MRVGHLAAHPGEGLEAAQAVLARLDPADRQHDRRPGRAPSRAQHLGAGPRERGGEARESTPLSTVSARTPERRADVLASWRGSR